MCSQPVAFYHEVTQYSIHIFVLAKALEMRCLSASGQQAAAKPQFQESGHVKLCQVTFISGVRRDPAVVDCLIQRSIELLNQPIQFGGPLTVPVQFPLQLLCGVVLLKLGGGVHLLHKAFLIRARVGADGSDGVKNQRPNRRCGDAVSKTFSCFLSGAPVPSRFKNHLLPV